MGSGMGLAKICPWLVPAARGTLPLQAELSALSEGGLTLNDNIHAGGIEMQTQVCL